jgi:hypothetical protein
MARATAEESYEDGYLTGTLRKEDDTIDVRYAMADAAKSGDFAAFKRGMEDALDGKPPTP